jgi:glycosyltransferase involved in cell wall biosynthesis
MSLLTIVIANYNNGHLLRECIDSILSGGYQEEVDIIVVDDCSTDNSREIIHDLSKHIRLCYYFREENGGVEAAFNTGISLAKGKYLHLFAADDRYVPGGLPRLVELIKKYPKCPLFSSDYASFPASQPHLLNTKHLLPLVSFRLFSPQEVYCLFRHTHFWIPGHTAIVLRSLYPPQDCKLRSVADWYINHNIALESGVGYFPEVLIARREDPFSYSVSANFDEKRAIWLHLLTLISHHDKMTHSGICRMLGLKSISRDLLKPRYWKYLFPMLRKEIAHRCFDLLKIDSEKFWLTRLDKKSKIS